ncbi:VOC family protein [Shouchella shacheensis]|uniref:VOC family protein n=1 Tax=Shouchella shacheensis TaxID=1649580 RepID=UPI00073FAB96|nr:VOC family protein [Shouchella shacheensis]
MNSIHLICLAVNDIGTSLKFYRDGLGFKTSAEGETPAIVFFNNGGTKLELFPLTELQKEIGEAAADVSSGFPRFTLAHNVKHKQGVDELLKRAEKAGATIVAPAKTTDWGGYSGYFTDPDGFFWEVAYGADWRFDEHDMLVIE